MKSTAHLLGLLFATLAVTALGADTPAAPAPEAAEAPPPALSLPNGPALSPSNGPAVSQSNPPNAPAAIPPAEPVKAEPAVVVTPPALSPPNGPALSPSSGPALSPPGVSPLDSARGLSLSNGQSNPSNGPAAAVPFSPLANGKVDDPPADPDVLELPKMVVKQKPRPRLTPQIMTTKQAFGEELARQKTTQLDQVLNKYTLPLFGSSLAERVLDEHEREKKQEMKLDVLNMVQALDTTDPTEAESLKKAVTRP